MAEDQSWVPRRRLRHLNQVALCLLPSIRDDHHALTLALFSSQPAPQSTPPVLLHASSTVADISPVFSGIEPGANCSSERAGGPHVWEASTFRLIVISHGRHDKAPQQAVEQSPPANSRVRKCRVCLGHASSFQPLPHKLGNAQFRSACKQFAHVHGLRMDWCCQTHKSGRFPVASWGDCMQEEDLAQNSTNSCHQGKEPPKNGPELGSLAQLSGVGLATIRESRCLSDKQLPDLQPEGCLSGNRSIICSEQHHVSVSLSVQSFHVRLQLAMPDVQLQCAEQAGDDTGTGALETCTQEDRPVAEKKDSTGPDGNRSAPAACSCRWQLHPRQDSSASVLFDDVIDLNADVMAVPLHFSRAISCRALPGNCVMLGVRSGCEDLLDPHWQGNVHFIQQQALLLYPNLEERTAQQFLQDNQARKQDWRVDRTRASQAPAGGLVDAIVNTLFPFPLPPARHLQSRHLPRTTSSPSVRDAATGASSSPRIARSHLRHRRQRSFDSAPGLQPSGRTVGLHDATLTSMSTTATALAPSRRRSATLSTSSASTAGSDTRSTVLSRKPSSAQGVAGQRSMPAMQYIAFTVREVAELVSLRGHALARAAMLKERVATAVDTCKAVLDLEARVKRLQVKTQQLRLRNDDVSRRTTVARRSAAARKQRVLEQQERLQEACGPGGPLASCLQRAKEQRLCYPDMLHTWRHTHGLLVTRRHQLVISLFHHFRLQPQAVVRYAGGVLTEMQDLWMHQRLLQHPSRRSTGTWSSSAAATGHRRCGSSSSVTVGSRAAESDTGAAAGPAAGPQAQTHCEDGLMSKLTPVMTVMGLQCAPDVARRAQLGELGWETSSALQLDHMNTAYGYIAQVVVFLGSVLDVPPLYHLELEGSYCRVQQHMPRTPRPAVGEAELYEEEHAHTLRLTEHPLFVDQGKHEGKLKQFAWGCFLLGANVQQLLHEHDIVPHGQQFLLENLEKLVASARISGLKPAF